MKSVTSEQKILRHFSRLFRYPDTSLPETASACYRLLLQEDPQAAEQLQRFRTFVEVSAPEKLEETFTATFELQPLCHPYVAYQLCGESQQRTLFLIKLKEVYRQHGYDSGHELPDHFSEMLGFAALTADPVCRAELVSDALLPALGKLVDALDNEEHPYRSMLVALHGWLDTLCTTDEQVLRVEA